MYVYSLNEFDLNEFACNNYKTVARFNFCMSVLCCCSCVVALLCAATGERSVCLKRFMKPFFRNW